MMHPVKGPLINLEGSFMMQHVESPLIKISLPWIDDIVFSQNIF